MKYNDYIILTDEDYNNMKSKYNVLDELDKEKLLDIYNSLTKEYVEIASNNKGALDDFLSLTKKHINLVYDMLSSCGVTPNRLDTSKSASSSAPPKYYNPLSRLFLLNRPPRPPRPMPPPFFPYPNELDLIDLIFMYLMMRPHCRFNGGLCSIAHDRVEYLKKMQ